MLLKGSCSLFVWLVGVIYATVLAHFPSFTELVCQRRESSSQQQKHFETDTPFGFFLNALLHAPFIVGLICLFIYCDGDSLPTWHLDTVNIRLSKPYFVIIPQNPIESGVVVCLVKLNLYLITFNRIFFLK